MTAIGQIGCTKTHHENLIAHQEWLEAQHTSERTRQSYLDASVPLNILQGQAESEEGVMTFLRLYGIGKYPKTFPSEPTRSTPPSPPKVSLNLQRKHEGSGKG
jgi:hypothetical protein